MSVIPSSSWTPVQPLESPSRPLGPGASCCLPRVSGRDGALTKSAWPLLTCSVTHALKGREPYVRRRLEQSVPSVWLADSEPTMEDIVSWRSTLASLLREIQLQFELPLAWVTLGVDPEQRGGARRSPLWPVLDREVLSAFYRSESMRQSADIEYLDSAGHEPLFCVAALEKLYLDYSEAGGGVVESLAFEGVDLIRGDGVVAWSMLLALYTVGVLGFAVDSFVVVRRVQTVVRALWPCVKRILLATGSAV